MRDLCVHDSTPSVAARGREDVLPDEDDERWGDLLGGSKRPTGEGRRGVFPMPCLPREEGIRFVDSS